MRSLIRSVSVAIAGALIGATCLTLANARRPAISLETDKPLASFVSGIYAGERDDSGTFAWTSGDVVLRLDELNRSSSPWSCLLRFRSPRPAGLPQPVVDVLVNGESIARVPGTGEYQDFGFRIPQRADSTTLAIHVDPTFQPGTADKRTLGIQVSRLSCAPTRFTWPPAKATLAVALATAFLAGITALVGLSLLRALVMAVVIGFGCSAMLTTSAGMYGGYAMTVLSIALRTGIAFALVVTAMNALRKERLSPAAVSVLAISMAALFLKLLGLVHPAKPVIDAMFHAHRFDDVLAGRYTFTQPFVGGVQMPYAIGLYLFTSLWQWVTSDHMALVRGVTAATDVAAGALLYPVILHAWNDRRTAVLAVVAYQLLPLSFALLGNANLTNVFGESIALVTIAVAVSSNLQSRRVAFFIGLLALVTAAFCSHVSTITTLSAMLAVLALLYFWSRDKSQRWTAMTIVAGLALGLVLSWLLYYRFFSDELAGAFTRMLSGAPPDASAVTAGAAKGYMSTSQRVGDLLRQAASSVGWPLLFLAGLGAYDLLRRGARDRLTPALMAWSVVWVLFSASTVFAQVGDEYVRYAAEFLGRINLATLPMIAILAGKGAAAPGLTRRALSWTLLAWAVFNAWGSLMGWFSR